MGVAFFSSRTFGKPTDSTVVNLTGGESPFYTGVHPCALLLLNSTRNCGQRTEALVVTAEAQDENDDIWLATVASEQAK